LTVPGQRTHPEPPTVRTRVLGEWMPANALAFRDARWPMEARSARVPATTPKPRMVGRGTTLPVACQLKTASFLLAYQLFPS
ncbi:MAG: hypothetical protein WCD77_02940, partial [Acidobacteriaceae bacterium]